VLIGSLSSHGHTAHPIEQWLEGSAERSSASWCLGPAMTLIWNLIETHSGTKISRKKSEDALSSDVAGARLDATNDEAGKGSGRPMGWWLDQPSTAP
jgi:hypothetical protein